MGNSRAPEGYDHALITGPDGVGMRDLGTLGGIIDSAGVGDMTWNSASGINDAGQVVGWSTAFEDDIHAFVTGPNGVDIMDLNSPVDLPDKSDSNYAYDINNIGQVIATAHIAPTPIPEPGIYALFLAGLDLTGFMARRKKAENLIERYCTLCCMVSSTAACPHLQKSGSATL